MADVETAPAVAAETAAPAAVTPHDQQPKTGGKAKAAAKEPEKPDSDLDLPRALVKRIVKTKLAALAAAGAGDKKEFQVNKDALTALSESTKVFISYIASTANDICREKKRQTLSADDVFAALTELEFSEFVEPLQKQLEAFKTANKEKAKARQDKEKAKRRRQEDEAGGAGAGPDDGEQQAEAGGEAPEAAAGAPAKAQPAKAAKGKAKGKAAEVGKAGGDGGKGRVAQDGDAEMQEVPQS